MNCGFAFGFTLSTALELAGAGIGLAVGSAPIFTSNCGGLVITVAVGCVALGGCCACALQKTSVLPTSSVLSSVFFILFVV